VAGPDARHGEGEHHGDTFILRGGDMPTTLLRLAAAATILSFTACGRSAGGSAKADNDNPAARKAGAESSSLTLTIADSQPVGRPTNIAAVHFADDVNRLSHGAIVVKVVANASELGPTFDEPVIAAVEAGTFDLATIPARAWSGPGTEPLVAIGAPFEIVSLAHMSAVAVNDALVGSVYTELDQIGVHGLALWPESLRLLFSFADPIVTPDQLPGVTLRSIAPHLGDQLSPLGVNVVNPTDSEFAAQRIAGTIGAAESDFLHANDSDIFEGATATADAALYPKFVTLVANAKMWSRLDDHQRDVLQQAAALTRDQAIQALTPMSEQAKSFCSHGGAVVLSGDDGLAAFRNATAGIVSNLEQPTIEAIRSLTPSALPESLAACDGRPSSNEANVQARGGDLPDGVYRLEWTPQFAHEWNSTHSPADALLFKDFELSHVPATFTWTFVDGHYSVDVAFRDEQPSTGAGGVYQVAGHEMLLRGIPDVVCVCVYKLRWSVATDGSLTLQQIDERPLDPYFAVPWVRIGDAPSSPPTSSTP
jgi:TRAP-type C4-dicarboxylate transport system substrate-binding protein